MTVISVYPRRKRERITIINFSSFDNRWDYCLFWYGSFQLAKRVVVMSGCSSSR